MQVRLDRSSCLFDACEVAAHGGVYYAIRDSEDADWDLPVNRRWVVERETFDRFQAIPQRDDAPIVHGGDYRSVWAGGHEARGRSASQDKAVAELRELGFRLLLPGLLTSSLAGRQRTTVFHQAHHFHSDW